MTPSPTPTAVSLDGTDWVSLLTAGAAFITAIVAVVALYLEGRRTRRQLGITNMWRLIEYWDQILKKFLGSEYRLLARVRQREDVVQRLVASLQGLAKRGPSQNPSPPSGAG